MRKNEPHSEVKWWAIWAVNTAGVYFGCISETNLHEWEYLMDSSFELSTDGGKTWRPCFKIEEGA